VAISIMAEVIAARSGRVGQPLVSAEGSIRPRATVAPPGQVDTDRAAR
jgi:hypothetical protein